MVPEFLYENNLRGGRRMKRIIVALTVLLMGFLCFGGISFGQPIENEFYLITPVSKDVHDPALKAFAAYVKKK